MESTIILIIIIITVNNDMNIDINSDGIATAPPWAAPTRRGPAWGGGGGAPHLALPRLVGR